MGVVVVTKTRTLILPALALFFLVVLSSSILWGRAVAAQLQERNSASVTRSDDGSSNSIDNGSDRGYRGEHLTARGDPGSAHERPGNLEKLRDTANRKPWSPVHPGLERVQRVLNSPGAVKVLARCRTLGMIELVDEAFEISGSSPAVGDNYLAPESNQGPDLGYIAVPMINPRGNKFATTMLSREEDGSVIAITVDTETGELQEAISSEDEPQPIKFDKKKWVDCFTTTCGPCIAGCAFTGPFWLKCAGACCGVAAAVCAYVAIEK